MKVEIRRLQRELGPAAVYRWLKESIFPAALLLASDDIRDNTPVRIRLKAGWLLGGDGKPGLIEPWDLTDTQLAEYLRTKAAQRVEEGILSHRSSSRDFDVGLTDQLAPSWASGDDTAPTVGDSLRSPIPDPEESFLKSERSSAQREHLQRFLSHVEELSADDRKLLVLRSEGREYAELEKLLSAKPAALRKRFERLRSNLREKLKPPVA